MMDDAVVNLFLALTVVLFLTNVNLVGETVIMILIAREILYVALIIVIETSLSMEPNGIGMMTAALVSSNWIIGDEFCFKAFEEMTDKV